LQFSPTSALAFIFQEFPLASILAAQKSFDRLGTCLDPTLVVDRAKGTYYSYLSPSLGDSCTLAEVSVQVKSKYSLDHSLHSRRTPEANITRRDSHFVRLGWPVASHPYRGDVGNNLTSASLLFSHHSSSPCSGRRTPVRSISVLRFVRFLLVGVHAARMPVLIDQKDAFFCCESMFSISNAKTQLTISNRRGTTLLGCPWFQLLAKRLLSRGQGQLALKDHTLRRLWRMTVVYENIIAMILRRRRAWHPQQIEAPDVLDNNSVQAYCEPRGPRYFVAPGPFSVSLLCFRFLFGEYLAVVL